MTVTDSAKPQPIDALDTNAKIVDPRTGFPTMYFAQLMQKWRANNLAGCRVIPCNAVGKNVITLTPFDASPLLDGYRVYDRFTAFADLTSDGAVTATVVPTNGTLATLKVYKSAGAAQAGSGDVVAGSLYDFIYADHLDSGNGGFVLK